MSVVYNDKYDSLVKKGIDNYLTNKLLCPATNICDAYKTILEHYLKKYLDLNHMVGFEGEIINSDIISDQELIMFYNYMTYDDKLKTTLDNWDQNLFCVFCGIKPMALIDNDCLMDDFDDDIGCDYKLRHTCSIYGMERITFSLNYDPANLYYWPKHWKNAAILYKYYIDEIKLPKNYYHIFSAILLGYTLLSFVLYDYGMNKFHTFVATKDNDDGTQTGIHHKKYDTIEKMRKHYPIFYNAVLAEKEKKESLWIEVDEFIKNEMDKLTDKDMLFFRGV